jgi:hypothetical protein
MRGEKRPSMSADDAPPRRRAAEMAPRQRLTPATYAIAATIRAVATLPLMLLMPAAETPSRATFLPFSDTPLRQRDTLLYLMLFCPLLPRYHAR